MILVRNRDKRVSLSILPREEWEEEEENSQELKESPKSAGTYFQGLKGLSVLHFLCRVLCCALQDTPPPR